MDVRRISLIAGLAIVSYIMILQWSNDYSQPVPASNTNDVVAITDDNGSASHNNDDVPQADQTAPQPEQQTAKQTSDVVEVTTNTLDVKINLKGGDIIYAALPKYPYSLDTPNVPFRILETDSRTYIAQSGLVGKDGIDANGRAQYQSAQSQYQLGDRDSLDVVLTMATDDGLKVNKIYSFKRDSYLITVRFELDNESDQSKEVQLFGQLRRDRSSDPSTQGGIGMSSYLGATFSTQDSTYKKVSFGDLDDKVFSESSDGGWVAFLQHYFLTAWVPTQSEMNNYYGKKGSNDNYYVGFKAPLTTIAPQQTQTLSAELYVGPKIQSVLAGIASNLEKTVDYGWLWWIAKWLFWLMDVIHSLVGNWGWSIILMTLIVKMLLMPLTASSYRSMAKMRKFTPRIQELREQFGDDRQRMSQEMMKLYQKEKLNPLGGCLPMLLQMPIFIALYWVLKESVELRQSPFMFWIVDLSIKDPYFVLPLLMGASMFIQMQMQQQPTMDPMQAKIMKLMPVMFTFMFLWFPAGLTLYWFVNNVITIVQQYLVNKSIERKEAKAAA